MSLDLSFPQGHPLARFCRWCRNPRVTLASGVVVCQVCDGVLSRRYAQRTQEHP